MYSCISPRHETPSYLPTPGCTPLLHTPTPALESLLTALAQKLIREKEAYEAFIKDDGQPSHPIKPGLKDLDKLRKYDDIISYWKSIDKGLIFMNQLSRW